MSRTCQLERPGYSGPAVWELTADTLVLTPQGCPVETWLLREARGLDWDDWGVRLSFGAGDVKLSRLGSEASGLVETLRATWPPLRADALRLASGTQARQFRGSAASRTGQEMAPAGILVGEDALLLAPKGQDIEPVFLASLESVTFDETSFTLAAKRWAGGEVRLGKLGGQTQEVQAAVDASRARLASEAAALLAAWLPTLSPVARTTLASRWLPGRLLSLEELDALAPGAVAAIAASWVAKLARRREATRLLGLAAKSSVWLGYTRLGDEDAATVAAVSEAAAAAAESLAAGAGEASPGETDDEAGPESGPTAGNLWAVVAIPGGFLLESLGARDMATYCFRGDATLLDAIALVACAPQYSREAVYMPLENLTGARAHLAVAATDLAPLQTLRRAFVRRVIHRTLDSWENAVTSLATGGVSEGAGA
jgi:hypothetical protein